MIETRQEMESFNSMPMSPVKIHSLFAFFQELQGVQGAGLLVQSQDAAPECDCDRRSAIRDTQLTKDV